MALEGLSEKLQSVFSRLSRHGKLTEKDIQEAMREVRVALLEADVNFAVVKDFVKKVSERAKGQAILTSLTPAQQVIKIVNEELTALMGSTNAKLTVASNPPTIYMIVGLQGTGKTSTSGKMALWLKKKGKRPLLTACDIYRPAAIRQLQVVGEQAGVTVFEKGQQNPVITAKEAVEHARLKGYDTVILDTAGRLHIDEELMNELAEMKAAVKPHEILLTVDAMTGQDAVNVATAFNDRLGLDGIILTKLDGDTRGGAVLSVKAVTGKPVKFTSAGEKIDEYEPFYPDRMASRILGMGDVMSLIEKATERVDQEQAEKLEKKFRQNSFDLEDYLDQLKQMRKMGPLGSIMNMLPGVAGKVNDEQMEQAQKQLAQTEAIIHSMTRAERRQPELLNASRRKRIAAGSGTEVQDVNRMIKQFEQVKSMMKQFGRMGKKGFRGFPMM